MDDEILRKAEFDLGDILSVTTARLVGPNGMDGVRSVIDFLAGRPLMSYELAEAQAVFGPHLVAHWPHLGVEVPDAVIGREACDEWVAEQKAKHGATHSITILAEPAT